MTGIYVRIMREQRPQNLLLEELSPDELRDFISSKDPEWVIRLLNQLLSAHRCEHVWFDNTQGSQTCEYCGKNKEVER